jgi:F-type H+-transporting ATPase subunit delta
LIGSRVSRRYAKALFSIGREDGQFERYGQDLNAFTRFYQQAPQFRQVIVNPVFDLEDRQKVLQVVLERSGFSATVRNFLNLLLDKNRMGAIEAITEHYAKLTDEVSGIARAEIITARALKEDALAKLEQALESLTSKKIKSEVKEDRSLIGGIVVRIGDMVMDGSVKAQIEGLKESF